MSWVTSILFWLVRGLGRDTGRVPSGVTSSSLPGFPANLQDLPSSKVDRGAQPCPGQRRWTPPGRSFRASRAIPPRAAAPRGECHTQTLEALCPLGPGGASPVSIRVSSGLWTFLLPLDKATVPPYVVFMRCLCLLASEEGTKRKDANILQICTWWYLSPTLQQHLCLGGLLPSPWLY